jgi:WD40 repeat protein
VDRFTVWDVPSLATVFNVGVAMSERFTGDTHLNHDGSTLSGRNSGGLLRAWNVPSGRRLPGGTFPGGDILDLAVGPVDGRLAVVSSSRTLTQLDPVKGTPIGARLTGLFNKATYSPDQRWLAVTVDGGGKTPKVQLYNAESGELLATIPDARGWKMWFSVDGRRLMTSNLLGQTTVISLESYGGPVDQLSTLTRLLTGIEDNTSGVGFMPMSTDSIRTNPETYRRAFRAWKGLSDMRP